VSRNKKKREKGSSIGKIQFTSRVEKEYLKPSYSASIGEELEDGLFDGNMPNIFNCITRSLYIVESYATKVFCFFFKVL
jgi:hypothetical protein